MTRVSFAILFASESNPQDATQRKRRPLTSPTSIVLTWPSASTPTDSAGSLGIPSTRARSLPRPPGRIPRGVSVSARTPPTWPISPSPLITTGISPTSAALCASLTPCSRLSVRTSRYWTFRRSSSRSTAGRSFRVFPPAECGLTSRRWRESRLMRMNLFGRVAGGAPGDEIRTFRGLATLNGFEPGLPESALENGIRRIERSLRTPAGVDDGDAAGPQDAGDLREERRHVELSDQVEGVVAEGQVRGVADLERDPALGIQPDPLLGATDHLLGEVDAAHPGARELAGDQQRAVAETRADVERPLGLGTHVERGRRKRGEVDGPRALDGLRPVARPLLPVTAAGRAQ